MRRNTPKMSVSITCLAIAFLLSYWSGVTAQCDGENIKELNADTNVKKLRSPNFPGNYPRNSYCQWLIIAPVNHRLRLKSVKMDLETSEGCVYDSVTIYDGNRKDASFSPQRYCAQFSPINSTGRYFLVIFKADADMHLSGFDLHYHAVPTTPPKTTHKPVDPLSTTQTPERSGSKLNTAILIGGVVGGICVVIILGIICSRCVGSAGLRQPPTHRPAAYYHSHAPPATPQHSAGDAATISTAVHMVQNNSALFMVSQAVGNNVSPTRFTSHISSGVTNMAFDGSGDPSAGFSAVNSALGSAIPVPIGIPPPTYTDSMLMTHPPAIPSPQHEAASSDAAGLTPPQTESQGETSAAPSAPEHSDPSTAPHESGGAPQQPVPSTSAETPSNGPQDTQQPVPSTSAETPSNGPQDTQQPVPSSSAEPPSNGPQDPQLPVPSTSTEISSNGPQVIQQTEDMSNLQQSAPNTNIEISSNGPQDPHQPEDVSNPQQPVPSTTTEASSNGPRESHQSEDGSNPQKPVPSTTTEVSSNEPRESHQSEDGSTQQSVPSSSTEVSSNGPQPEDFTNLQESEPTLSESDPATESTAPRQSQTDEDRTDTVSALADSKTSSSPTVIENDHSSTHGKAPQKDMTSCVGNTDVHAAVVTPHSTAASQDCSHVSQRASEPGISSSRDTGASDDMVAVTDDAEEISPAEGTHREPREEASPAPDISLASSPQPERANVEHATSSKSYTCDESNLQHTEDPNTGSTPTKSASSEKFCPDGYRDDCEDGDAVFVEDRSSPQHDDSVVPYATKLVEEPVSNETQSDRCQPEPAGSESVLAGVQETLTNNTTLHSESDPNVSDEVSLHVFPKTVDSCETSTSSAVFSASAAHQTVEHTASMSSLPPPPSPHPSTSFDSDSENFPPPPPSFKLDNNDDFQPLPGAEHPGTPTESYPLPSQIDSGIAPKLDSAASSTTGPSNEVLPVCPSNANDSTFHNCPTPSVTDAVISADLSEADCVLLSTAGSKDPKDSPISPDAVHDTANSNNVSAPNSPIVSLEHCSMAGNLDSINRPTAESAAQLSGHQLEVNNVEEAQSQEDLFGASSFASLSSQSSPMLTERQLRSSTSFPDIVTQVDIVKRDALQRADSQ